MSDPIRSVLQPSTSSTLAPVRSALLQRCACGGSKGLDDQCAHCKAQRLSRKRIQAKLTVSDPADPYELEADQVADQVIARQAARSLSAPASIPAILPKITPLVQRDEVESPKSDDDDERKAQRAAAEEVDDAGLQHAEDRLDARSGTGQPLGPQLRNTMETRFGADFSTVRIHTDAEAGRLSDDLSAHAFTYGSDIYFRPGAFAPDTTIGQKLIAHELTHVVQQESGSGGAFRALQRDARYCTHIKPNTVRLGKLVHNRVEKDLRAVNPELVTEAPIPGGTERRKFDPSSKPADFTALGGVDLYKATPAGKIVGIQGELVKGEDPKTQEGRRFINLDIPSCVDSAAGLSSGPDVMESRQIGIGTFPSNVEIADLKPMNTRYFGGVSIGVPQIDNYIGGFNAFATDAQRLGNPGHPNVTKMQSLNIPDPLDYNLIDTPARMADTFGDPGAVKIGEHTRLWLAYAPASGLLLYFGLPHPPPMPVHRQALDRAIASLRTVTTAMRPKKRTIPPKRKKFRRKAANHDGRAARARRSARIVQRATAPATQSPLEEWEALRAEWTETQAAPLLGEGTKGGASAKSKLAKGIAQTPENSPAEFTRERGSLEASLASEGVQVTPGVSSSFDYIQAAKDLQRIEYWAGTWGRKTGALRFKLDPVLGRVFDFIEKAKGKFPVVKKAAPKFSSGAIGRLAGFLVPAAKLALAQFMRASLDIFLRCFQGLLEALADHLVDIVEDETKEFSEKLTTELEALTQGFENLQASFERTFGDRLAQVKQFEKTIEDIQFWTNIGSTLINVVRLAVQAISCLSPPAAGCLWGLVAQVSIDVGLNLIIGTTVFQDMVVNPTVQKLINQYASPVYRQLMRDVLVQTPIKNVATDVEACGPLPPTAQLAPVEEANGLTPALAQQQRVQWEVQNESLLLQQSRENLRNEHGGLPSENEVRALIDGMKASSLTPDQLRAIAEAARIDKETFSYVRFGRGVQLGKPVPKDEEPQAPPRPRISIGTTIPRPMGPTRPGVGVVPFVVTPENQPAPGVTIGVEF